MIGVFEETSELSFMKPNLLFEETVNEWLTVLAEIFYCVEIKILVESVGF
jgi:hypothetical protein